MALNTLCGKKGGWKKRIVGSEESDTNRRNYNQGASSKTENQEAYSGLRELGN